MRFVSRIPQPLQYAAVVLLSLAVSLFFIWLAVRCRTPSLGGIGGALGDMAAFASLFIRPDFGLGLYKISKAGIPKDAPPLEQLQARIEAIETAIEVNSNGQVFQNWSVAIATIIGTLFWAIGEFIAQWLLKH